MSATLLDQLEPTLGRALMDATVICAVPHWWTDELALALLEHAGHNGTSRLLVDDLKRMPFVEPHESSAWRIADDVRAPILARHGRDPLVTRMHALLAERFSVPEQAADDASLGAREQRWQRAYHLSFTDHDQAATELLAFANTAIETRRLADSETALETFRECLPEHEIEAEFVRGRLAYAVDDHGTAREAFERVWNAGRADGTRAFAGHLLGSLLARRPAERARAEEILRDTLALADQIHDERNLAMVLCTLAHLILTRREKRRYPDAEQLARRSIEVGSSLGPAHAVRALTTLGEIQVAQGSVKWPDARATLAQARELGDQLGQPQQLAQTLLVSSWLARDAGNVAQAAEYMNAVLRLNIRANRTDQLERGGKRMRDLLQALGGDEAWSVVVADADAVVYVHESGACAGISLGGAWPTRVLQMPLGVKGRWRDNRSGAAVVLADGATVAHATRDARAFYLEAERPRHR
jgi:hypothetical protein